MILPAANILQPLINIANGVLQFFHDNVGLSWGALDHRPDRLSPGRC